MLHLVPVFISTLFLSLNLGALVYINSSYLSGFFSSQWISALYLLGAIGNILLFLVAPRLLNKLSHSFLFLIFLIIVTLSALGMALSNGALTVGLFFVLYSSFLFMAYYCLDIFVEEATPNKHTGELRGIYFTFINAGIALGPLLVSLLSQSNLKPVYFVATLLLVIPIFLSALLLLRGGRKNLNTSRSLNLPFKAWWRERNVRAVTLARLVLETFFALMVIYTPIYLHENLGFNWGELGLIFTVMLMPFVLFEWPVGELADRYYGEKEIMTLGFFITGTSLLIMPFLDKSFIAWLVILFLSRVGASLIEITTESYFFKKIHVEDTGFLGIFRLARPVGYVIGAAIGALTLNLFSFEKLFFLLAIIVFFGMKESLYIKDTR